MRSLKHICFVAFVDSSFLRSCQTRQYGGGGTTVPSPRDVLVLVDRCRYSVQLEVADFKVIMPEIKEFKVKVPQEKLDRLKKRLDETEFPTELQDEPGWDYGSPM